MITRGVAVVVEIPIRLDVDVATLLTVRDLPAKLAEEIRRVLESRTSTSEPQSTKRAIDGNLDPSPPIMRMTNRPPKISEYHWDTYLQLFATDSVFWKREGLRRIARDGWAGAAPHLLPFLDDDEPYAFDLRGTLLVVELRAEVLETVEALYRQMDLPPDFGPVKVRPPMPAEIAIAEAASALGALAPEACATVLAPVDAWLARQQFAPEEVAPVRAYRILQALGKIDYRLEVVDPHTYVTPIQQEIIDGQTRSPRPRPHLRVASANDPTQTLGWIYRVPATAKWTLDFSHSHEARDVVRWVQRAMSGLDPAGVPRVVRDAAGEPLRRADDRFVFNGVLPLDTADPVELLQSVQALIQDEAYSEIEE